MHFLYAMRLIEKKNSYLPILVVLSTKVIRIYGTYSLLLTL